MADPKDIAITLLLISVLFHYFSYSFTVIAFDYPDYDISLDRDDLFASGIMLGEGDEQNITYNSGVWTEFNIENDTIRCQWKRFLFFGDRDGILWQIQAPFFGFETWLDFEFINVFQGRLIRNETIITLWKSDKNRTQISGKTGYILFITDPLKQGNITRAVMEDGNLTLTLAENMAWASSPSLTKFLSWYIGLVTGSETWGLPDSFSILVRIMTMLGIFSGIFLMSELRRILIG